MTEQRHIGRYRVLEEIASGGQATVYLVWDPQTSQAVALKVMHRHLANDPAYIDRFQREAAMAASLSHPNIIHILEVGQEDNNHFIAMEYLPRSVHSVLGSEGALPLERAIAIARQVALALEDAQQHGIVHRDIKPHNILLTANDTVKVADFGIARGGDYGTLTATGMVMGTPQYMSPEQCRGDRADVRSDLYALGVVLYEMLGGQVPFRADSFLALLREVQETHPRPIEELRPDVPRELARIVSRCLEKDPARRYQTPRELAEALGAVTLPQTAATVQVASPPVEQPQPVDTIQVSPPQVDLVEGNEVQLTVVLRDASGRGLTGRRLSWSVQDPGIASVWAGGLVKSGTPGATEIRVTAEGQEVSVPVSVAHGPVTSVDIAPGSLELESQQEKPLIIILRDALGHVVSGREIAWSSDNPAVASVSPLGMVKGESAGVAIVTATCEGHSAGVNVSVAAPVMAPAATTETVAVDPQGPTVALEDPSVASQAEVTAAASPTPAAEDPAATVSQAESWRQRMGLDTTPGVTPRVQSRRATPSGEPQPGLWSSRTLLLGLASVALAAVVAVVAFALNASGGNKPSVPDFVRTSGSATPTPFPLLAGQTTISTVDTGDPSGEGISVAVGRDGFLVIAYQDSTTSRAEGNMKVAHCQDVDCSNAIISTVDSQGNLNFRWTPDVSIGMDGLPVISYYDVTNGDLRVAHCEDASCRKSTLTTVDSADDVGWASSLAVGEDGLPVISYYDSTNGNLKVSKCQDVACNRAIINTIDSAGDVGGWTSLAIGADGLPVISYRDITNKALKMAHCQDPACNSATINTVDSAGEVGVGTSLAIGVDGVPVISYRDSIDVYDNDLKVAHCQDRTCTQAIITTVDRVHNVSLQSSMTIGMDGLPFISYRDETNNDLIVAHCQDAACSNSIITAVTREENVGGGLSAAIGKDGLPVISYRILFAGTLKIAHCNNPGCAGDPGAASQSGSGGSRAAAPAATPTPIPTPRPTRTPTPVPTPEGPFTISVLADRIGSDATSIATGSDNLPVIGYYDGTTDELRVAHCRDAACRDFTISTIATSTPLFQYLSLAIGDDGLPVVAYNTADNDVKLALCQDVACRDASTVTMWDSDEDVGFSVSLAIGSDGLPVMSYGKYISTGFLSSISNLKVAHCEDAACRSATIATINPGGDGASHNAITIGKDGNPVISYFVSDDLDLAVVHCLNVTCKSANTNIVDHAGNVGQGSSIAIGGDGLPVISYVNYNSGTDTNDDLKVAHCRDAACSQADISRVDSAPIIGGLGGPTSLAIGTDGLPVISYRAGESYTDESLRVAHCQDAACSKSTITIVDSEGGDKSSIAVGRDGLPVISYRNGALKIARCKNPGCAAE